MKCSLKFLIISFAILSLISCEEKIDIELNTDENVRIVVDGMITDQPGPHYVKLSYTASYFYNQATPRVTDALVTISSEEGTLTLSEVDTVPGLYRTPDETRGIVGNTYTLHVDDNLGRSLTASCKLTRGAPIDSISLRYEKDDFGDIYYYKVDMYALEPAGKGDNYFFRIYVNDTLESDTLREVSFSNDELYDGEYLPGVEIYWLDEIEVRTDTFDLKVEMYTAPRSYYDFVIGVLSNTDWSGSIFSGPPANPRSNVTGDGLGYFLASSLSSYTVKDIVRQKR